MIPRYSWIKKVLAECVEQATIVSEKYGVRKVWVIFSEIWCGLCYGANSIDYVRFEFYKKNHYERNRYLTTYRLQKLLKQFGYYNETTYGKVAEYKTFADYIHRPWMIADKDTDPCLLKDFIEKQGTVFAKPSHGDQGKGVIKIKSDDRNGLEELLKDCKKEEYVVEGAVKNAAEISVINPSSLNTVRVTTLTDKNGEVIILSVILRAGAPGSHVDNWGAGGVGYNFNLETGVCDQYGKDKKNNKYIFHPGSNVQMIGFRLPYFEDIKEYVSKMAKLVPQARYIGWDVAITPNGFDLIEMNCPAGHDMFQSFDNPVYDLIRKTL